MNLVLLDSLRALVIAGRTLNIGPSLVKSSRKDMADSYRRAISVTSPSLESYPGMTLSNINERNETDMSSAITC